MINCDFSLSAYPNEAENFFKVFCKEFKKNHHKNFNTNTNSNNFLRIFGNSKFLSRFCVNNTWVFDKYQNSLFKTKEKPYQEFVNEIKAIASIETNPISTLKKYKYQELLRLTIKELSGLDQTIVYRELSYLAFAIINFVLNNNLNSLAQKHNLSLKELGFVNLIAMGKLGGYELNYSSDVDLIGVYDEDKKIKNLNTHEFYSELFSKTGKELSQNDSNGFFFRVDWDLRPEGKTGVLANSLAAMERYYQTFGQDWERQAFIKASPIIHSNDIGQTLIKILTPFVYRKFLDAKTIHNIWNMKHMINQEPQNSLSDGINVKLNQGGIRDIEFFAQGFQLAHGGKNLELRNTNTITTLNLLAKNHLIPVDIKNTLCQSYLFLRKIESTIQMDNENQTHILKNSPEHKLAIARRLGISLAKNDAICLLDEQLFNVRSSVSRIFKQYYEC